MKNQILILAYAGSKRDLKISLGLTKLLERSGYSAGLMLVIKDGIKGLIQKAELQYSNLNEIKENYESSLIIVMLVNFPLKDIDFLHNTSYAINHVKQGIDFSNKLPIGKRKILTFYLNSLITEPEFLEKKQKVGRKNLMKLSCHLLKRLLNIPKNRI